MITPDRQNRQLPAAMLIRHGAVLRLKPAVNLNPVPLPRMADIGEQQVVLLKSRRTGQRRSVDAPRACCGPPCDPGGPFLIRSHQTRVPRYVGGEDRGEAAERRHFSPAVDWLNQMVLRNLRRPLASRSGEWQRSACLGVGRITVSLPPARKSGGFYVAAPATYCLHHRHHLRRRAQVCSRCSPADEAGPGSLGPRSLGRTRRAPKGRRARSAISANTSALPSARGAEPISHVPGKIELYGEKLDLGRIGWRRRATPMAAAILNGRPTHLKTTHT